MSRLLFKIPREEGWSLGHEEIEVFRRPRVQVAREKGVRDMLTREHISL